MMKDSTILKTGVIGSAIATVCCATPVLVIALSAFGISAWLGWVDHVLIPALVLFIAITAYGLWRRMRSAALCAHKTHPVTPDK